MALLSGSRLHGMEFRPTNEKKQETTTASLNRQIFPPTFLAQPPGGAVKAVKSVARFCLHLISLITLHVRNDD